MSIVTDCLRRDGEYSALLKSIRRNFDEHTPMPFLANGICEGASDAFFVSLIEDIRDICGCSLIICPEEKDCVRMSELLSQFGLSSAFFSGRDFTFHNIVASHEFEHERLCVLFGILRGSYDAVLTTPDVALGYTIPKKRLKDASLRIDTDTSTGPAHLTQRLVAAGYARVDMVDGAGQFAQRGGIVDIYPANGVYVGVGDDGDVGKEKQGAFPIRVEFFGDEVDRLGCFDVETQRVTEALVSVEFPPAREVLIDGEALENLKKAVSTAFATAGSNNERAISRLVAEKAVLDGVGEGDLAVNGSDVGFADKYISLIYPEQESLIDYFDEQRNLVIIRSTNGVYERLRSAQRQMEETVCELINEKTISARHARYCKPNDAFDTFISKNVTLHVDSLSYGMSSKKLGGVFGFRTRHLVSYANNFALLCEDLRTYTETGYKTLIETDNSVAARSMVEMLTDAGFKNVVLPISEQSGEVYSIQKLPVGAILVEPKNYISGFEMINAKIAVMSTGIEARTGVGLRASKSKRKKKKTDSAKEIMSYVELDVGDYVVHESYGIGRYSGIETLTVGGVTRDYIGIQYAGSDKLYLPVEKLDMVSKYIGAHAEDGHVKLSKFGGDAWNRTKARSSAAVKDMAKELIQLYAKRMRLSGYAFPADDDFQRDFEAAFEYEETDDQLTSIDEIKQDMQSSVPMDRLLCGDVGFGKTEVALRAAYKAVMGGKQVAILVPTTILALQHYQTAMSRTRGFAVNVDMISRFRTAKQQAQTLRKLKRGEIDIIIGTHRLISKDVAFKDLGLVIVDEEQRFGVAQKEKLKQIAGNVDVLTLTATPIPRTLNMAMGGIRDISVLEEAPMNRLPVQTYVLEYDDVIIHDAIRREMRRGGQVFYLHNAIDTIYSVAASLAKAIPDAKITVAHGKMDKEELEDIWEEMVSGKIDILVCTTIIETGVDMPNANTLVIENSERFGLSQLHQLRGRIGRSSRRGYAYFTYPKYKALTDIAAKRLEAIREYAEFGAGFRIALRDLEIRGAGNVLGAEQCGHMEAIGYDLYVKMLNAAVLEEKGEAIPEKERSECTVTLDHDAYIPDRYVRYPAQRMSLYKRIANIENEYDRADIADELMDRYGEMPKPAENLLKIALIRALAEKCTVTQIKQDGEAVRIYQERVDIDIWSELTDIFKGQIKIVTLPSPHIAMTGAKNSKTGMLGDLVRLFSKYLEIMQDGSSEK